MKTDKIHLDYAEFYITNVCNLTCTNCNRFNNYNFRGWQAWEQYKDIYKRWAEKVEIDRIVILGGEPLLNPTILEWCRGLNAIFNRGINITTNGYRLNKVPGLLELLEQGKINLTIGLHNPTERKFIFEELQQFIGTNYAIESVIQDSEWRVVPDSLSISVINQEQFTTSAILLNNRGRFVLHDSDPRIAHDKCAFAQSKCYHFIKGRLYKCGPVALFPEFDHQFSLDISDQDRELLNSYVPLCIDDFDRVANDFFSKLDNPMPQCKFCPQEHDWQPLFAMPKSSRVSC